MAETERARSRACAWATRTTSKVTSGGRTEVVSSGLIDQHGAMAVTRSAQRASSRAIGSATRGPGQQRAALLARS